ncbi:class I SAM-dependent methyltransferase [Paraburkholderia sp. BR10923]|uniref:class I SAM-dependent methyltransferase n=1 Tax=Paraburkholderia sp. BR10923 TaxID=3236992 RepID=UPI0034CE107E
MDQQTWTEETLRNEIRRLRNDLARLRDMATATGSSEQAVLSKPGWEPHPHTAGENLVRYAFVTVTDFNFFPGTLATVNSVLEFQPEADIFIVVNEKCPLSEAQRECLAAAARVVLMDSSQYSAAGLYVNAWELKAYAAWTLAEHYDYDVVVGIDSDCILCSNVDAEIERCFATGKFLGGRDGDGADYDESYRVYGIETPARNQRYMSTSLYFCAITDANKRVLRKWAQCCNAADFNAKGPFPGHGDQGVLNAVLFAENAPDRVELLDNALWSQHWVYWDSIFDYRDGLFINLTAGRLAQRSFHCGGAAKFWSREHADEVSGTRSLQTYPYVWYLAMFWFGQCSNWSRDPFLLIPPNSHHLPGELLHFCSQIMQVYPPARTRWEGITDALIDRVLNGVPRAMSLGGGSMSEVFELVSNRRSIHRYVEIGCYEGGSILALAMRFANRDIDFYAVESFMGNMDGSMDGWPLPSRRRFMDNLARYPTLRVTSVPGHSGLAANLFDDASIDCVFIDACHETSAVLLDIDVWRPKLRPGGLICGDDYGWDSVREAVQQRFTRVEVSPSGAVWWTTP